MSLLPYSAYQSSGLGWLGEIPSHWEVAPIKMFGRLKGGSGFPHREQGFDKEELEFF